MRSARRALAPTAALLLIGACANSHTSPGATPVATVASAVAAPADPVLDPGPTTAALNPEVLRAIDSLREVEIGEREEPLRQLGHRYGGRALVEALSRLDPSEPKDRWRHRRMVLGLCSELGDPRMADALADWMNEDKSLHWQAEAAFVLAELGEVRSARILARRMGVSSADLYDRDKFWQADRGGHLSRTDRPRIVAARLLAELAQMHPERRAELRGIAADAVLGWLRERPAPHANGLRFIAHADARQALPLMRQWALPTEPLPAAGAMPPFPVAYETAMSGLRYLGAMRDAPSRRAIHDQFGRKDPTLDITLAGMAGAGIAMRGMALRAVAVGAAYGLAEWGDPQATGPLLGLIRDPTWNEDARVAACEALTWCADEATRSSLAIEALRRARGNPADRFMATCLLQMASRRPVPSAAAQLADALRAGIAVEQLNQIAAALGAMALDETTQAKLLGAIDASLPGVARALALLLGGSRESATEAVRRLAQHGGEVIAMLRMGYDDRFQYVSRADLDEGHLLRWADNAAALQQLRIAGQPQRWAVHTMRKALRNLEFDNGPRSLTRRVLRYRLAIMARTGPTTHRQRSIGLLQIMGERGALMALRDGRDETGSLAAKALGALGADGATRYPGQGRSDTMR